MYLCVMNFLAHAWLSGENEMVMAANVTGDAFKGAIDQQLPKEFKAGLQLHRFIDRMTDTHSGLKSASTILKPYYGRYSSVALDIWLDHILARDFFMHSGRELPVFAQWVYVALNNHSQWLNFEARHVARFMSEQDWLTSYSTKNYTEDVLLRMSKRFNAPGLVEGGHPDEKLIQDISLIFNEVKQDLIEKTQTKLHDLLNG